MSAQIQKEYKMSLVSKQNQARLWVATVTIKYDSERISISVRPSGKGGYGTKAEAEEKTSAEARRWIAKKFAV